MISPFDFDIGGDLTTHLQGDPRGDQSRVTFMYFTTDDGERFSLMLSGSSSVTEHQLIDVATEIVARLEERR